MTKVLGFDNSETQKSPVEAHLVGLLNMLLTNLPQIRDKISYANVIVQSKRQLDPDLLVRAAELSEQCYQTLLKFKNALRMLERSVEVSATGSQLPIPARSSPNKTPLTKRETQVLQLLAEGKSTKEIAHLFNIAVATVQVHRAKIMHKLDLHSIGEIIKFAIRAKLIEP
ncbi:MAG TPA: LuxR C-terminal-related transcriptional regulator [Candidatus Acidoferrum sp.]|jgi:DNA-binding NarL/FixJ family response regulator